MAIWSLEGGDVCETVCEFLPKNEKRPQISSPKTTSTGIRQPTAIRTFRRAVDRCDVGGITGGVEGITGGVGGMGVVAPPLGGAPHCGHAVAAVLISRPHSGHLINAITGDSRVEALPSSKVLATRPLPVEKIFGSRSKPGFQARAPSAIFPRKVPKLR